MKDIIFVIILAILASIPLQIRMDSTDTTAEAEIGAQMLTREEIAQSIRSGAPNASDEDVRACADALKNGGLYRIKSADVIISCSKEQLVRAWVPKN